VTRARRVLLGLVLLGALLLALVALGLFPQDPLRGIVESRLKAALGPQARVGGLTVFPGGLRAEARDVVLEAPGYRVELRRLRAALAPSTLWGPGLDIRSLEIDGARILLRPSPGPAAAATPYPGPVIVRELRVTDATLVYRDPALHGDVVLRGLAARGSLGAGVLAVQVADGTWERSPPVPIGPASARLVVSPLLDLQLEALDAGLARSRLRASGRLGRVWSPELDVRFEGQVDLGEVQDLAGIAPAEGTVRVEGDVTGPLAALRASARLATGAAQAAGWAVEGGTGRLTHDGRAGETQAALDLALLGGQGQVEARLTGSSLSGRLQARGLDLVRLERQAGLARSGRSGRLAADVSFRGAFPVGGGAEGALRVEGTVRGVGTLPGGQPVRVEAAGKGPIALGGAGPRIDVEWTAKVDSDPATGPVRDLQVTARGTARGPLPPGVEGTIQGTLTAAATERPLPIDFSGTFRTAGSRASVRVEARGLGEPLSLSADLQGPVARALELRGGGIDLGLLAPGTTGRARVELRGSGPLDALSGTGTVTVDRLVTRGIDVGAVDLGLQARGGVADLAVALPALALTGRLQAQPGPRPSLKGTLQLAQTPLAPFASLLPGGQPLSGHVTGQVDLEVPLDHPDRTVALARIESLEAESGQLSARSRRPFGLELRERLVTVRDLSLEGPGVTLEASGTVGTEAATPLRLEARVDVDLARVPVPEGWTATGAARADVSLSGLVTRPEARGTVDLTGVSLAPASLPSLTLDDGRLVLEGDAVAVPGLTAHVAGGTIALTGRVPLAAVYADARRDPGRPAPDEQGALHLTWQGVQAAVLARQLRPQGAESIEGVFQGEADLRGGLASLAEIQAEIRVAATTVSVEDVVIELAPATVQVAGGRVSTESLTVRTPDGSFEVRGHADLAGRREVALIGKGQLDLRPLSAFLPDTALTGAGRADLTVGGTLDAPLPQGTLEIKDGTLRSRALPQALTAIDVRIALDGTAIRLEDSHARLGGGDLALSGGARLAGTKVEDVRVTIAGRDLALAYPAGMRTRLDADLTLTGGTGAFLLAGTVKAIRGLYDLDVAFEESLTARVPEATDSPLLRAVALDVRVDTASPVLVRNNLAELQATGQLVVRGDMQSPAPLGTLEIAPGGKVFLQGREFVIRSGRLVYRGTWDPDLAITAASAKPIPNADGVEVEVSVSLQGTLESPAIALSSTPSYSERELINLIASGDTRESGSREALGSQAAALLAGRLARGLRRFGFDEVTIRPELVSREAGVETGARFTFGKHLTPWASLVYSLSLQDPEGRFLQLEVAPGREVTLMVQRTDDGRKAYGAGQRFRRGGPARPRPPSDERVRLTEVRLLGDRPLLLEELRPALGLGAGDRRTIWDLQGRAERLRQRLIDRGYLEAEVGARLEGTVAVFDVRGGAQYRWRVEGLADPPDLDREVRRSLFEEDALERGRARLLAELNRRGQLRASVATRTVREGDVRTLVFAVEPGPPTGRVEVRFPGASVLGESALLAAAGGAARLLTDPEAAASDLLAAYRSRHFLAARVGSPQVEQSPAATVITVPIQEGARARVGAVRFPGATVPEDELRRAAGIEEGAPLDEAALLAAVDRLRAHYFERGYSAVRLSPALQPQGESLDVAFQVAEGPRRTVGQVVVRGLRRTRESLVRGQVRLRPGRPVDPRALVAIERRLMDLGVFSRATVEASDEDPSTITVSVEEGDRLVAGYDLRRDDETGSRAQLDAEVRNLLGVGLVAGARYGVGRDVRDARLALSLPSVRRIGRLTASAFRLDEDLPSDPGNEEAAQNVRRRAGGQVQLTRRLLRRFDLLLGYRFRRTRVLPLFPEPLDIAGLDLSLLRDTRDSTLDARRGRFWSVSLEYSPQALGSDFTFVKGFGQVFVMRPLGASLTWAQGARLGLAHGFGGQRLISSERFHAGGANTIRGFATDSVGPRDEIFDEPQGGQAVVVLNEELRYHHPSGLGGAVFYDGGNVFRDVSDVSLDWRHAVGVGLRWSSPVGLLRFDLGVPLRSRPGQKGYRYFVSLGQAF
jgi:outer membrane protein assembly factor BamA/autotransporter translocation and assembly factor TamB